MGLKLIVAATICDVHRGRAMLMKRLAPAGDGPLVLEGIEDLRVRFRVDGSLVEFEMGADMTLRVGSKTLNGS